MTKLMASLHSKKLIENVAAETNIISKNSYHLTSDHGSEIPTSNLNQPEILGVNIWVE
jgi:hypothetical protein